MVRSGVVHKGTRHRKAVGLSIMTVIESIIDELKKPLSEADQGCVAIAFWFVGFTFGCGLAVVALR